MSYFNSQPHEEADSVHTTIARGQGISTHSLTKRLTLFVALWERTDLHFNSQPHEEADVGGDVTAVSCNIFQLTASRRGWRYRHLIFLLFQNISTHSLTKRLTRNDVCSEISEIFQLTASRRGWRTEIGIPSARSDISTHSLTKRLTNTYPRKYYPSLFQLTASRRGWHRPP